MDLEEKEKASREAFAKIGARGPKAEDHVWIMGEPNVPKISNKLLQDRIARLTPIAVKGGKRFRMSIPDLRNQAFTWDPQLGEEVRFEVLREVHTDHTCGYHGFIKPSIAEVLAQLPDDLPEGVNAFSIDTKRTIGIYETGTGHCLVTEFGRVV
jgi:hypothetical protein